MREPETAELFVKQLPKAQNQMVKVFVLCLGQNIKPWCDPAVYPLVSKHALYRSAEDAGGYGPAADYIYNNNLISRGVSL